MATSGDVNGASTTNVRLDGGKKNRKGKKHQVLPEFTPRKALKSHPPLTDKESDEEIGEDAIDVTAGEKLVARVEVARKVVEIFGRHMNVTDSKFKTLEKDFTREENKNILKELEGHHRAEFEMKEAITSLECLLIDVLNAKETITSLECRHMEAMSTIETMNAKIKALKEGAEVGRLSSFNRHREAKVKAAKTPMFKGVRDVQQVENFLWHLENYFKYGHAMVEAQRGRDQEGDMHHQRVGEFKALTLQIRNLTDEDMLFHFIDGLQSWSRAELECGQRPHPKKHDTYKSDAKKSGCHVNKEIKTEVAKRGGCYICGGSHCYARCPELKSLGAIVRERKKKESHEQEQGAEMTQLGLIGLCGDITKKAEKPRLCSTQYVDITINGLPARAMVDTGAKVNIMNKTVATRLGMCYSPSNAQLMIVNAPPTPQGGTYIVPLGKEPKTKGQVLLMDMQLKKNPKKEKLTFVATIKSSKEENGGMKSLPQCRKKVPRGNNIMMPKRSSRRLPPRKEVDREA
ncbi:hypothetical protein EJD97_015520 [Solanum chilense]|uniref:Retrotransposon gag domain-containing protein n=1 Tax=Solanum chilense TaxID=4083 RepID=A0A6N2BBV8_SOLCI|nr:hypothetical protein EJD97_015520 [Solanum chilense]